jgi:hypothetical protein
VLLEHASPVMRAGAYLHTDQAWPATARSASPVDRAEHVA